MGAGGQRADGVSKGNLGASGQAVGAGWVASGGTVEPRGEVDVCVSEGFASAGLGLWVEALCEA